MTSSRHQFLIIGSPRQTIEIFRENAKFVSKVFVSFKLTNATPNCQLEISRKFITNKKKMATLASLTNRNLKFVFVARLMFEGK